MRPCAQLCLQKAHVRARSLSNSAQRVASSQQKLNTKHTAHDRNAIGNEEQRELLVDILSANATRRDAKQYLARFKSHVVEESRQESSSTSRKRCPSVNLGSLYTPTRAIADSPQFVRTDHVQEARLEAELHASLISVRGAEGLNDGTIDGLATTVSQLVKLDMRLLLVVAPDSLGDPKDLLLHAERLVNAISKHSRGGARLITQALTLDGDKQLGLLSAKIISSPLLRGTVAVIPTIAYDAEGHADLVSLLDTMTVLTAEAAELRIDRLDRIIMIDQRGGIPSRARRDGAHLFVNVHQEYQEILDELRQAKEATQERKSLDVHVDNLNIAKHCLAMLSPSSSALIVTPQEAASSSGRAADEAYTIGAGTRRKRNTLIHNLLTNKPLISSSLPLTRFAPGSSSTSDAGITLAPTATLLKKGMPLAMIPGEAQSGPDWRAPASGRTDLDLRNDPRVDLDRLIHLINDSFRRQLDVHAYLERIAGRVAGLIIAGDYEGCAILTWEQQGDRLIPYLDKFAVLQSSQGSAGVADIVFQAMVRTCFPNGVCWRSRSNNPVNKWYFERAAGSWDLPGTQWTMFWTGEGVVEDQQKWDDYVAVCKSIVPTWLDGKKPD